MSEIYLDNSATTRPSSAAIEAMNDAMINVYGNPSSIHKAGSDAAQLLLNSRNEILCAIHGASIKAKLPRKPMMKGGEEFGKLIFTSGGTEANNLAIFGTVTSCKKACPEIITTNSEHPSVLSTIEKLAEGGCKVHKLRTANGVIDLDELKSLLSTNTALVSIMHVNNETGAIYDVESIFKAVKSVNPDAVCHTDCVQSFQKIPFTPKSLGADMISISAHKVHGPKGVGALWVSKELIQKKRPYPILIGGGQEEAFRSGTENLPGIASFAAAVKSNGSDKAYKVFSDAVLPLRAIIENTLPCGSTINLPKNGYAPHIISIALPIPKSQPMLNYLSALGIYVSSGSACSSKKNTVSHVLSAFGLPNSVADATIRVSLDASNTEEEIRQFISALSSGIEKLK